MALRTQLPKVVQLGKANISGEALVAQQAYNSSQRTVNHELWREDDISGLPLLAYR